MKLKPLKFLSTHSSQSCIIQKLFQLVVFRFICFIFWQIILLILIQIIGIFIILVFLSFLISFLPFFFILSILHFLLTFFGNSPQVFSSLFGSSRIICDHKVVEDGSRLDLPQIKSDLAVLLVFSNSLSISRIVFWIVNLWVNPSSFIFWVIDHWRLPFTIHLVIPILWLGSIRVSNMFWFVPIFGFGVFWVIHLSIINPIGRLLGFRVLDFLGWKEIPIISKGARLGLLIIDQDFIRTISIKNKSVQVSENVILASDVFL